MKNVLMVFMMACFCLLATSSISAQSYVNQEEASIRLKSEIQELTPEIGEGIVTAIPAQEVRLKLQFMNGVLDELPQSTADYDAHIDNVFNELTENQGAKIEFMLTEIRTEVIELISE